jgi:hypothetical protein
MLIIPFIAWQDTTLYTGFNFRRWWVGSNQLKNLWYQNGSNEFNELTDGRLDRPVGMRYSFAEPLKFYQHDVYDGARAHPAFYSLESKVSSSEIRQSEREVELWLPYNAEVNNILWHDARKPEEWSQNRRSLLCNHLVNTFQWQRIRKQQSSNFCCYATALLTRLPNNRVAVFPAWPVQIVYKEESIWILS